MAFGVEMIFCPGDSVTLQRAEFCRILHHQSEAKTLSASQGGLWWAIMVGKQSRLDGVGKTHFPGFLKLGVLLLNHF